MGLKKKFYGNVERTFLVLNFLSYDLINRFVTPWSIRELYRSINKKNNEKTGYEKKLRLILAETWYKYIAKVSTYFIGLFF